MTRGSEEDEQERAATARRPIPVCKVAIADG